MRIGVLGAGDIGRVLIYKLAQAGHSVKAANSRGPESISLDMSSLGARAVTPDEAVLDADAVIVTIPTKSVPAVAPLFAALCDDTVVIDTTNYYPSRDGRIEIIDNGATESSWVAHQLGRPVAKAWNSVNSASLMNKGKRVGDLLRLALPVAADRERDLRVAMALVEDLGFDAFASGPIEQSWRQQPGAPAYCTDLDRPQLAKALRAADKARLSRRRDLALAAIEERAEAGDLTPDYMVRLTRTLFS